jgi:chromosome segregation ATPase
MQRRLDDSTRELAEEEARQMKRDNEARRDHIVGLNADRDNLAAELARLQRELHSQAATMPMSRPQMEQHEPALQAAAPRANTQKQQFKSSLPKKKKMMDDYF